MFDDDGAPPQYNRNGRSHLHTYFSDTGNGRKSAIEYPLRSPDLTFMDLCIYENISETKFNAPKPKTIETLKLKIKRNYTVCNLKIKLKTYMS